MPALRLAIAVVALFALAAPAQEARGPSTPEERTRVVQIARDLQTNPLAPKVQNDREWAMRWLIEVPDITVTLCDGVFGDFFKEKGYTYSSEILATHAIGSAAFIIENPKQKEDEVAIQRAGVMAALAAYQVLAKKDPERGRSPALEELLKKRQAGELDDIIKAGVIGCESGPRVQT